MAADANARGAPVYLIDASIYVFRAWFSVPDTVADPAGQPINALVGFFDFLTRFLRHIQPRRIVVAFDESLEQSYRNEIYPAYKANREPAPVALKRQFAHCRRLAEAFGIGAVSHPKFEADDLIGTVAARERAAGRQIVIITGDKDLAQLVESDDLWWDYTKNRKLDADGIARHFGVAPARIPDLLALAGDAVDNIPGIPGIGPQTAKRLLQRFDSLENVLACADEIAELDLRGAARIADLVAGFAETARLSRKLSAIHCETPLEDGFDAGLRPPDADAFAALAEEAGFSPFRHRQYKDGLRALGQTP